MTMPPAAAWTTFAAFSAVLLAGCRSDGRALAADAAAAMTSGSGRPDAAATVTMKGLHADCTKSRRCLPGQTCSLWHDYAGRGHWTCEIVCDPRATKDSCPPPLACGMVSDGPSAEPGSCIDIDHPFAEPVEGGDAGVDTLPRRAR